MSGSTTTFTTARLLTPDYLVQGRDNVISCPLWASGALVAPSSGTVSVYDTSNTAIVSAATVTVSGSVATYTIPAATLPTTLSRGMGWRVEWTLVVGGVTTVYRNSAGLVRSLLAPVVTDLDLYRREPALNPSANGPLTSETTFQAWLDEAWVTILGRLAGKGNLPHLVMEPSTLREPHLYLALSLIFESMGTKLSEANAEKATRYHERFEKAWSELAFEYDASDSGQSDGRRKRAASPTLWLGGWD